MAEKEYLHYSEISPLRRDLILFWSYAKIAALVVGGGYAILAAAQKVFVSERKWITEDDVVEMVTISQTIPGIIACNTAAFIGWKVDRWRGAFAAVLGAVFPSFAVVCCIASGMTYLADWFASPAVRGAFTGVVAAITAMVVITAVRMRKKTVKNIEGVLIAIGCFLGMSVFRFNPGILIAAAILVGITAQSLSSLKRKHSECAEKEEKK